MICCLPCWPPSGLLAYFEDENKREKYAYCTVYAYDPKKKKNIHFQICYPGPPLTKFSVVLNKLKCNCILAAILILFWPFIFVTPLASAAAATLCTVKKETFQYGLKLVSLPTLNYLRICQRKEGLLKKKKS